MTTNTSQVDNKVVQMEFDNKNFEKNVQTTLKTLQELEGQLQFKNGTKGIDQVQDKFDKFTTMKIEKGLVQVQDHFSVMNTVAFAAISNITNSVVNLGKTITKNIISPITSGGLRRALNIEQANFQLAGLNIEKTGSSYEQVMKAVQGTAYSYDVAAKAASQLAASEIGVTKQTKTLLNNTKVVTKVMNDDMYNSILGIAGVSAMTNSSFEDISRIFTRVAGQGRVMATDLNSISARGINAAATIAEYLTKVNNGVKVTESEVRDLVSKGKIDFETFSNAMTQAFGQHAKDSTQTFTGAIEDMKAALSRIGADFYTPAIEGVRRVVNSFTPLVDTIHEYLNPSLERTGSIIEQLTTKATGLLSAIDFTLNGVEGVGDTVSATTSLIQNGIKSIEESTKDLKGGPVNGISILAKYLGIKDQAKVEKKLKDGEISLQSWSLALDKFASKNKKAAPAITEYLSGLNKQLAGLEEVGDSVGASSEAVSKAMDMLLNKFKGKKSTKVYEEVGKKLNLSGKELKEGIENGTVSIYDFRNALKALKAEGSITETFFTKVTTSMDKVVASNDKVKQSLTTTGYLLNGIKNIVGGFKSALSILGKTVVNVFSGGKNKDFLSSFAKGFYNVSKLFEVTEKRAKTLEKVFSLLFKPLEIGIKVVKTTISYINKLLASLMNLDSKSIGDAFWILTDRIANTVDKIIDFINAVKELPAVQNLIQNVASVFNQIPKAIQKGLDFVGLGSDTIAGFKEGFLNGATNIINNICNFFSTLIESVKHLLGIHSPSTVFAGIGRNTAEGFGQGFLENISKVIKNIINVFNDLTSTISKNAKKFGLLGEIYLGIAKAFGPLGLAITIFPKYIVQIATAFSKYQDFTKAISKANENIKKEFSNVFDSISKSTNSFKDNISKNLNEISKIFSLIAYKVFGRKKLSTKIVEAFMSPFTLLNDLITKYVDMDTTFVWNAKESLFDKIINTIFPPKTIWKSPLKNSKSLIDYLSSFNKELSENISNIIETLSDNDFIKAISKFISTISDKIGNIDFGQILAGGIAGGTFFGIYKFITLLGKIISPIGGILSSVVNTLGALDSLIFAKAKELKSEALKNKADAIKSLAEALAIVVGSIILIANVPWSSIKKGTVVLLGATAILLGFLLAVEKLTKVESEMSLDKKGLFTKKKGGIAANLIAMGASIYLIAMAFKKVASVSQGKDWYKPIIAFFGMLTTTIGFFAVMGTILEKNKDTFFSVGKSKDPITVATKALAGISASMIALAKAMQMISTLSAKDIAKSAGVITGFFTLILLFQKGLKMIAQQGKFKSAQLNLLEYAAGLGVLVIVIKMINNLSLGEILKGMGVIIALEACVVALMKMMDAVSVKNGIKPSKFGATILGINAGIILLAAAMRIIAGIKTTGLIKSITAIVSIMGMIGLLMIATSKAGKYAIRAGVMIAIVSGSLLAISASMLVLANIPTAKLFKALSVVEVLMYSLSVLTTSMVTMSANASLATTAMSKMAVVMGLIVGLLVFFTLISPKRYIPAIAGVSLVLYTLSLAFTSWSRALEMAAKQSISIKRAAIQVGKTLAIVGGVLLLFSGFLKLMDYFLISGDMILKSGIAIASIMTSVGIIYKSIIMVGERMNKRSIGKAIVNIGIMSVLLATIESVFAAFMIVCNNYGVKSNDILKGASAIVILFTGITIVMSALNKMNKSLDHIKDIRGMTKKLISNLISIAALMTIVTSTFAVAMIAMTRAGVSGNDMIKGATAFGILLLALTYITKSLSHAMKNSNGYTKGSFKSLMTIMTAIAGLMATVSVTFAYSMSKMSKNGVNGTDMIKGATAFSILLGSLTVVIAGLSAISSILGKTENIGKVSRGLSKVIGSIGKLMLIVSATFGASMIAMSKSGVGGNAMIKGAEAFSLLIGALTVVMGVMIGMAAILSKSEKVQDITKGLNKIIWSISKIMTVVGITFSASMIAMTKYGVTGKTMLSGAIALSGILVALTVVIGALLTMSYILTKASPETIAKIGSNLSKIIGYISALVLVVGVTFAASMSMMVSSGVKANDMIKGAEALSILLGTLTGVVLVLSVTSAILSKLSPSSIISILPIISSMSLLMVAVGGTFAVSMSLMASYGINGGDIVKGAKALAIILGALTAVMVAVDLLATFATPVTIANMGIIMIAMASFGLLITAIFDAFLHNTNDLGKSGSEIVKMATSLAIVLNSLLPAFAVITSMSLILANPISWTGIIAGIVLFEAFLASILGLVELLGEVATPEVKAKIENGFEVLNIVANGLGEIVGSIVGGVVKKAGGALGEILEVIVPLLERIEQIKSSQSAVTAIERLMKALASFKSEGLAIDASKIEGLSDIARQIKEFVGVLGTLKDQELKTLDTASLALYRIGKFMLVSKELDQQGVYDASGKDALSSFQLFLDGCKTILLSLENFYNSKAFDTSKGKSEEVAARIDAATKSLNALKSISVVLNDAAEFANKNSGLLDDAQFRTYIVGMEDTLKALSDFVNSDAFVIKNNNSNAKAVFNKIEAAVKATEAIKVLSEACKNLNTGFFVNTVTRLSDMGNVMGDLGNSISDFSKNIPDLKNDNSYEKINRALTILSKLAKVSKTLGEKDSSEFMPDYSGLIPQIKQSTSSLGQLADDMNSLGGAINRFANNTSDFTEEKVQSVTLASKALEAVGKALNSFKGLGNTESTFNIFSNETEETKNAVQMVDEYSKLLPTIGKSFAKFTNSITSFTKIGKGGKETVTNSVEQISQAIEALNSIAKLSTSGQNFDKVKDLGSTISDSLESLSSVKEEDAKNAGVVINAFVSSFGGKDGSNSIDKLSVLLGSFKKYSTEGLGGIGTALNAIITSLDGSGSTGEYNLLSTAGTKDNPAAKAGQVIKDFVNSMTEEDINNLKTLISAFGSKNIDINILSSFGTKFVSMISNLGSDTDAAQNAGKVLNYFISAFHSNVETDMQSFQSLINIINSTDTSKLSVFGTNFNSMLTQLSSKNSSNAGKVLNDFISAFKNGETDINNLKSFINMVNSVDTEKLSSFATNFKFMINNLKDSGNAISAVKKISNFADNIDVKALGNSLQSKLDNVNIDTKSILEKWTNIGRSLTKSLSKGISKDGKLVKQAFININKIKSIAQSGGVVYQYWYTLGTWLTQGFARGIRNANVVAEVRSAGENIGLVAYRAAKAAIQSSSPSKLLYKLGKFFTEGYADGIIDRSVIKQVKDSTLKMASVSVSQVQSVVDIASEMIESMDINTPIISPVVDLDNVYKATSIMDNILNLNPTAGIGATIKNADLTIKESRQNGSNKEIVSAIGDLNDRIDTLGTTNITNIDGITYDDGSNVSNAVGQLIHEVKVKRRV